MLVVETPSHRAEERDYILGIVLGDHLGLEWIRTSVDRDDVSLHEQSSPSRRITMPDTFFAMNDARWLQIATVPSQPVGTWDSVELELDAVLCDRSLPVLFGELDMQARRDERGVRLPIDIFGSAFFMLSRYEEFARPELDGHGRFPASASLAHRGRFLDRPVVDEYTELLWAAMNALWPRLVRRRLQGSLAVTCDVDNPYAEYTRSWASTIRKFVGDVTRRKSVSEGMRTLANTLSTRRDDYHHDPYDMFDWMLDVNERAGNRMSFYFLCTEPRTRFDAHYSIQEPRIGRLLKRIVDRGHEVGLHGSYHAYRDSVGMAEERMALQQALRGQGIEREIADNRQHYLRWHTPETPAALETAGFVRDSTLGYADHAGFRCGTCRPFPLFDLTTRRHLSLVEHPLIAMDNTIIESMYMGLGYTQEGLAEIDKLRSRCMSMGGRFTLLWHNSTLRTDQERTFYEAVVGGG